MTSQIAFNEGAVRGVSENEDLNPDLINRDVRPFRYRLSEFYSRNGGLLLILVGIVMAVIPIMGAPFLYVGDVLLLLMLPLGPIIYRKRQYFPYREPILPGADGASIHDKSGGMFFLGNDLQTGAAAWLSNDDLRTHMLVFGSTGSGKTRFLLGMLYQSLLVGSGAMYVDGKGDNTVFWLAYTLCRRLGRDDDLLVINYLVGEKKQKHSDRPSLRRISNTSNMLAYGDAEQLRSLIVGLMREAGSEGQMWKGRASAMLGALFNVLVYLRDEGEINLDVDKLREFMPLDTMLRLYQRKDLPGSAITSLLRYLADLPGFNNDDALRGQLNPEAYKQHGFLMMQLTEVLSDLSDTYGHIFSAPMGEVDFKDVVFNRRILFVMLPALQKDPDSLAGLGKMVVAGVRAALAPALGDEVEGSREEVIAAKPSNSRVPFLIILDEYGYYAVKGFAVVAAQARSLGVSVIFAGQDYPSFKRSSEEEAASTVANTNAKLAMKNEDAKETGEIFINRTGESDVVKTSGHERKESLNYHDTQQTRVESKKRVNIRDLADQDPGQAHMIFADKLSRMQLFFADPEEARNAQINRFLMVDKPEEEVLNRMRGAFDKIEARMEQVRENDAAPDSQAAEEIDQGVITLVADFARAVEHKQSLSEASVYATAMIEVRNQLKDKEQMGALQPPEPAQAPEPAADTAQSTDDEVSNATATNATRPGGEDEADAAPAQSGASENALAKSAEQRGDDSAASLAAVSDEQAPAQSSAEQARQYREAFIQALTDTAVARIRTTAGRPLTAQEEFGATPRARLGEAAAESGHDAETAEQLADEELEFISQRVTYIDEPVPEKPDAQTLEASLQQLKRQTHQDDEHSE